METIPSWAVAIGAILGLVIPSVLSWLSKHKDEKEANDLIVKTNPPDPDGIADIDSIQRMQDDRNISPGQ